MSTQKKYENLKDLIVGLAAGEAQCLEKIYHRYAKNIYGVARSFYFSAEDSEEIVQEVFLKVWTNREKIDLSLSFESYIITVAKNTILNVLRSRAMHQKYILELLHSSQSVDNEAESRLNFRELSRHLELILHKLSDQRRKVFVLTKMQGYSVSEVSEKMNLSKRTVEHHLYHAVKFVRAQLNLSLPDR